ncbi:MAG: ATP-grasp domain-containing protein [Candidatus Saccharimonadales bacterium]|nr:ATP-grasp domain-containing protein [Candidatus Saccharimonadales bacterium]
MPMSELKYVVAINDVQPAMPKAVGDLAKLLGEELAGLALVDMRYEHHPMRKTQPGFEYRIIDFFNDSELKQLMDEIGDQIIVATCRSERSMPEFMKLIPLLNHRLKMPSVESIAIATNKYLQKEAIAKLYPDIVAKGYRIKSYDEAEVDEMASNLKFPLIVKPAGLAASLMVSAVQDLDELKTALKTAFEQIETVYKEVKGRGEFEMLFEEMIDGEMYSLDSYVDNDQNTMHLPMCRVLTGKDIGFNDYYGYVRRMPTDLSAEELKAAEQVSNKAIEAIDLRNATAHIELFKSKDGWKLIEINARVGGYRDSMYRLSYGINHSLNDFLIRLDPSKVTMPGELIMPSAAFNFYAKAEGILTSITGAEAVKELKSTQWVGVNKEVGDKCLYSRHGGSPIIESILAHRDPAQLDADIARQEALIKFQTKPATG